jgi:hypothetical protein
MKSFCGSDPDEHNGLRVFQALSQDENENTDAWKEGICQPLPTDWTAAVMCWMVATGQPR